APAEPPARRRRRRCRRWSRIMTAPAAAVLAEHAAEIRRLGKQTVENVVEMGRRLTEAKEIAGHGNWLPWLDREFGWKEQTARNFMQAYELSLKSPNFGDLEVPVSALYMLAAPSTPQDVRDEVLARAQAVEPVTVSDVKTAIANRKPEPTPNHKYQVKPAAASLFANEDQLHAFAGVVSLRTVRRFITFEQQVDLAKQLTEGNIRAAAYQPYVADWLRQAGKLQGRIDAVERDDFYKEFPGYEIRDVVAEAKSATRPLVASLLKLEDLFKKFPHHPFFGDIGGTLDDVINMIRQYRRAAGEHSADETERKLARLQELEQKARTQETTIEELHRE